MKYVDGFASLKALNEAMNPRWLREMNALRDAMHPKWMRDVDVLKNALPSAHLAQVPRVADLATVIGESAVVGKYVADTVATRRLLGQSFAAQFALNDAAGKALGNVRVMQDLLRPHHEFFADRLRPFDRFEQMFKPMLPSSVAAGLSGHFQKAAIPLASLVAMTWPKPLSFLTAAEEFYGASLAWPSEAEEGAEIAMLIQPHQTVPAPSIVIEVKLVCLLCGDSIFHRSEAFEWVARESRGLYQTEVLPLCPACLREDPQSYVERLVEALQAPRRPRLTLIKGGGEGTGERKGRDHVRLVAAPTDDGDEND